MEDGTFASLTVLLLVVCFLGGFVVGTDFVESYITTSHCQNIGYVYGSFDWGEKQIVCWDETPAQGLEE